MKSMLAISHFDLSPTSYFAPPLYSFLVAFLSFVAPHPFAVADGLLLLVYFGVILTIGWRLYGYWITIFVTVATLAVFSKITLDQWIIPWNSSLSAALLSALFVIFFYFDTMRERWRPRSVGEWGAVALFFVCFGAMFATRPLDLCVAAPVVVSFLGNLLRARQAGDVTRSTLPYVSQVLLTAAISASIVPLLYLAFNYAVFGSPFGGYFVTAGANGYFPLTAPRKAVSILLDSSAYGEDGQSLVENFWPAMLALPVLVTSLFFAKRIVRIISLSILLQFAIYLPYADLLPANLIRYMTIHYFKWTLPWMALLAAGQLLHWLQPRGTKSGGAKAIACTIILSFLFFNLEVVVPDFAYYRDSRSSERHDILIDVDREKWFDTIDVKDGPRSFSDLMFELTYVEIDGQRLRPVADFRMFPAQWGTRIVFTRTVYGGKVRVVFAPWTKELSSGPGISRMGTQAVAFWCRIRSCRDQDFARSPTPVEVTPTVPPRENAHERMRIVFSSGGNSAAFVNHGWEKPEDWGTWTSTGLATVSVPAQNMPIERIQLEVTGVLSGLRPSQPLSVSINDCVVITRSLHFPGDLGASLMSAEVPPNCTKADASNEIAIGTDQTKSQAEVGRILDDNRQLGVGVLALSIW
ncbi:hypothetical protein C7G41_36205 [Bradyrhizobium sp. MOS002]|nr:hypothetical protein C7G41_36205 [Bradyrhizobium sp. MOS002]